MRVLFMFNNSTRRNNQNEGLLPVNLYHPDYSYITIHLSYFGTCTRNILSAVSFGDEDQLGSNVLLVI